MRRVVLLVVLAVVPLGIVGHPSGIARACSCIERSPVDGIAQSPALITGKSISSEVSDGVRTWNVVVDRVLRGAVPRFLNAYAEVGTSCGDPPEHLSGTISLQPDGETFRLWHACMGTFTPEMVRIYFDEVPPLSGRGPPAAIVAFDASGVDLAVVDASGLPLAYLAGDGPTIGLAICPDGFTMVQLRADSYGADGTGSVSIVRWDLHAYEPISVHPAPGMSDDSFDTFVRCDDPQARQVVIVEGSTRYALDGDDFKLLDEQQPVLAADDAGRSVGVGANGGIQFVGSSGRSIDVTVPDQVIGIGDVLSATAVPEGFLLTVAVSGGYRSIRVSDTAIAVGQVVPPLGFGRRAGAVALDLPSVPAARLLPAPLFQPVQASSLQPTPSLSPQASPSDTPDQVDRRSSPWPWAGLVMLALAGFVVGVAPPKGRGRRQFPN